MPAMLGGFSFTLRYIHGDTTMTIRCEDVGGLAHYVCNECERSLSIDDIEFHYLDCPVATGEWTASNDDNITIAQGCNDDRSSTMDVMVSTDKQINKQNNINE